MSGWLKILFDWSFLNWTVHYGNLRRPKHLLSDWFMYWAFRETPKDLGICVNVKLGDLRTWKPWQLVTWAHLEPNTQRSLGSAFKSRLGSAPRTWNLQAYRTAELGILGPRNLEGSASWFVLAAGAWDLGGWRIWNLLLSIQGPTDLET